MVCERFALHLIYFNIQLGPDIAEFPEFIKEQLCFCINICIKTLLQPRNDETFTKIKALC